MKCPNPITLKNKRGDIPPFFSFPCGKCLICRERKTKEWTVRIEKELHYAKSAYFVTLTYAKNPEVLLKKDIQDFMKRLRKVSECRYYIVGEYGGKNKRPHWHMLLFNFTGNHFDIVGKWNNGFVQVGTVTTKSIKYVLSYLIDLEGKNMVLMSRRPGIGFKYLENKEWHRSQKLFSIIKPGGSMDLLPRYYKDKMFNKYERRLANLKYQKLKDKKDNELLQADINQGDNHFQLEINRIEQKKKSLVKRYKNKKL